MKKLFFLAAIAALLSLNNSRAQSVVREGNTFMATKKVAKCDTLVTGFRWKDSKGVLYPIIINKSSGACYVWKKSSKSGKMYKQYLLPEVSAEICRSLGIKYQPKRTKK